MKAIRMLTAGIAAMALSVPLGAMGAPADTGLTVGDPLVSSESGPTKIDVMALWSHPDDDAGFTTPCGVWGDLYDIKCGIIMTTRGEGGSNSVGNEAGPDLGLRRENEDRASHVRTGTVDIFNIDKVDFYYNTSSPLTEQAWDGEDTLRRIVRVIRETQPSVMIGWPPNFDYGHGNHQYAGRLVWEAVEAAADPERFPEQLTGDGAVEPWQVKKVIQQAGRGMYGGEGGQMAPDCNVGFTPADDNPFTIAGTWSGYESPYEWVEGNTAGIAAGTPKTWAQVGREGGRAHPTQARVMQKDPWDPECLRYVVLDSYVPMQPNGSAEGDQDQSLFWGAAVADPGGFPLETLFRITPDDFYVAPGEDFEVTVDLSLPEGSVPDGEISLEAPDGWTVSEPVAVGGGAEASATFTVTPAADAPVRMERLAATFSGGGKTAWNDTRVSTVPQVQGLFARGGTSQELDAWIDANDVHMYGRAPAIDNIGAGESKTIAVEVTNRTSETQSGTVGLAFDTSAEEGEDAEAIAAMADDFVLDETSKAFDGLAPGETATVEFVLTHTDPSSIAGQVADLVATTTIGDGESSEAMQLYVVPTTVIPQLDAAPTIDGAADDLYTGDELGIGRKWEGDDCDPDGTDCGDGSVATVGWYDDALYAHMTVVDDRASAAATIDRCFGHWLVDSVEFLVDPRGDSPDTSTTFKLGIFPFTDDAEGENGNGVDGPCWSRDADHHQGFSTGPLAELVEQGPNAPGVEVAVSADRNEDGTYVDGRYTIEIKAPMANFPAAVGPTSDAPTGDPASNTVDPQYMGFNLTPYDSDNQNFIGETRTAWSPFGSQQSEPLRWGHAYLEGYEPPADRAEEASDPIIPDTALQSVASPQTIYQSAARGVTMAGVQPSESLTITEVTIEGEEIVVSYDAAAAGTIHGFVWHGDTRYRPVWTSSCDLPDDYELPGFDACSDEDGKGAPWAPDMGGALLADGELEVAAGAGEFRIPVTPEALEAMATDSHLLLSWKEAGHDNGDGVKAWAYPIVEGEGVDPTPDPTDDPTEEPTVDPTAEPTVTPEKPKPGLPSTGV